MSTQAIDIITPHAHRRWRRELKEWTAEVSAQLRAARAILADPCAKQIPREDAIGEIEFLLSHRIPRLRESYRGLRDAKVVKYSNLSPKAAARMKAQRSKGNS